MPHGTSNLKVGDIFELKNGMQFYAQVAEKYIYANRPGSNKKASSNFTLSNEKHLKKFAGKYIVVDTRTEGGGTGMGPRDVYPDGHHIYAKKLIEIFGSGTAYDRNGLEINFYQSGAFTAMNRKVKVVGKKKKQITFI